LAPQYNNLPLNVNYTDETRRVEQVVQVITIADKQVFPPD
jgi:hypothetical protein